MNIAVMILGIALLLAQGDAHACSILNEKKVTIGDYPGIEGVCSNNGLPISCQFVEGEGITCDGPAGSYTGDDLKSLIFSACGCSTERQEEQHLKKELENPKK